MREAMAKRIRDWANLAMIGDWPALKSIEKRGLIRSTKALLSLLTQVLPPKSIRLLAARFRLEHFFALA